MSFAGHYFTRQLYSSITGNRQAALARYSDASYVCHRQQLIVIKDGLV